jgi:hypothetical protein
MVSSYEYPPLVNFQFVQRAGPVAEGTEGPSEGGRIGNVTGFVAGFFGVRVWVGNFVPPRNLYPWHGFWVTCNVTHHTTDSSSCTSIHIHPHPSTFTPTTRTMAKATTAAAAAANGDNSCTCSCRQQQQQQQLPTMAYHHNRMMQHS